MTDCSSFHSSNSSSSDLNSHHGAMSKIRTLRLVRPHTGNRNNLTLGHPPFSSYGFSLRGGREFGTGFFVSSVVKGSEADLKGLQVGDQIIRVGGSTGSYRVDDAVHKELSQFIINQDRITLKVRGVGIIPVKEKCSDPLTWHVVPLNSSMVFAHDDVTPKDIRIVLNVAPRTKLGCGICKGPDWKPGIFVQFTKENGIARESGLRPGDQILSCNGVDFSDIAFSEAVSIMKNSSTLELSVRTCVGLDLFPGESSGYNSSASSITGDQSPCWGEAAKRLSIVREESTGSSDRMNGTFKFRDRRKDKPLPVDVPKIPSSFTKPTNTKNHPNTTIIKLSEDGPTMINNTMIPDVKNINNTVYEEIGNQKLMSEDVAAKDKIANICFVSRQNETKIVTVEVHRSSAPNIAPPPQFANQVNDGSNEEPSSSSEQSSLSSAITEELKRRAEKKLKNSQTAPSEVPQKIESTQKKTKANTIMGGHIHNILMDEFKKAHQKMFKNGYVESEYQQSNDETTKITALDNNERKLEERQLLKKNVPPIRKLSDDTKSSLEMNGNLLPKKLTNELPQKKKAPPPPPVAKKFEKQVSLPASFIEPVPDYDSPNNTLVKGNNERPKGTMGRIAMQEAIKANGDLAEMESIESFQLNNPSSQIPVPPPMYFSSQKSGPPTMKKIQRPISVIINSYDDKKEPGKFDFIEAQSNAHGNNINQRMNEDMSTKLKNELEKTLSRSNLRRRTDSLDDLLKSDQKMPGNIMHINNNLNKDLNGNKLPYDVSKLNIKKYETSTLNGILKNGSSKINGPANGHAKNITFGEVKHNRISQQAIQFHLKRISKRNKMMLKLAFLSLIGLVGLIQCFDDNIPFVPDFSVGDKQPKIVGGIDAYIEDAKYQVSLRRFVGNDTDGVWGHSCGGFIISQDAIVTAAHCIYGRETSKYQIRAGSDLRSQGGQIIDVKKFFLHEDYQPSGYYNDIAIVKLEKRLTFNSKVWSIPLPPKGYKVPDGDALLVSGWGALSWQGSSPERLQKVYVPAVSNEQCARAYSNIRDHKICAGAEGLDSCQGDSGGPMTHKNFVVGVVSSGYRCAYDGFPGIYTRFWTLLDTMWKLVGVLLTVFACVSANSVPRHRYQPNAQNIAGEKLNRGGRIVGGSDARIEDHPYQIALFYQRRHTCGGSILNQRIVLSASHCTFARDHSNFQILSGTNDIRSTDLIDVSQVIEHPDYDDWTLENDIVVLKLIQNLIFDNTRQPLPLPVPNFDVASGRQCSISGWGDLEWGTANYPDILQNTRVPAMTNEECQAIYTDEEILDTNICAGERGRDACQGDSGGPLVYNGVHVGIVSWGYYCALDYPTVYARVSEFLGFILSNL
ncbi:CLUMA_CG020725, isoform A [Clunio marinus]|uniref:CLUMA_CG020725, isoform A n=1 Tax=Clunio marinus TaxID=568069 RepID=A0A1J1J5T8_9DIPT|nr:CLUMA_CG020725, isoform A [Clunio marinus]